MNNFLNQLNLTPQERRIVVIVFLVVIVVLNLLFVWPHFGEWGSINKQLDDMRGTIAKYNRLIAQDINTTNGFQVQVKKLSSLEGSSVIEHAVDPSIQLSTTIQSQEHKTGVSVSSFGNASVKTNEFFEEISMPIEVQSQETNLISFLYNMGLDPAMIRVTRLDLQPDDRNTRYHLKGSITLTANYLKRQQTALSISTNKAVAIARPAAAATSGKKAATTPPPAPAQTVKQPPSGAPPPSLRQPRPGGKPNIPDRPTPFPRRGPRQPGQNGPPPS